MRVNALEDVAAMRVASNMEINSTASATITTLLDTQRTRNHAAGNVWEKYVPRTA